MYGYGNSMFLATHGILARSASTPSFVGLLDTYSSATAAYSLRRLSSTYTSNLIRVRRSSDTTNGVAGVWYCSKYQPIDELVPLSSLADGKEINVEFNPLT